MAAQRWLSTVWMLKYHVNHQAERWGVFATLAEVIRHVMDQPATFVLPPTVDNGLALYDHLLPIVATLQRPNPELRDFDGDEGVQLKWNKGWMNAWRFNMTRRTQIGQEVWLYQRTRFGASHCDLNIMPYACNIIRFLVANTLPEEEILPAFQTMGDMRQFLEARGYRVEVAGGIEDSNPFTGRISFLWTPPGQTGQWRSMFERLPLVGDAHWVLQDAVVDALVQSHALFVADLPELVASFV